LTKRISDLTLIDAKQFHTFYDFAFTLRLVLSINVQIWELATIEACVRVYVCVCVGKYVCTHRPFYETLMNYLQ